VRVHLAEMSIEANGGSPEQAASFLQAELAKMGSDREKLRRHDRLSCGKPWISARSPKPKD